jgi:hypothetical protein
MKRRDLGAVLVLVILVGIALLTHHESGRYNKTIIDISWPNCNIKQTTTYAYGIVGVTGGLDFRPNTCLAQETHWFASYSLYMNTGYPGEKIAHKSDATPLQCSSADSGCFAYNYGYNAALYALNYAALQNAHSPLWWLDVETDNSWSSSTAINEATLEGANAAIQHHIMMPVVGFYSSPYQWNTIVGNWQNDSYTWIGTGGLDKATGEQGCTETSFTGGPVILSQYTLKFDENVPCYQ